MNGTELIKNLNWLGRMNELMDRAAWIAAGELIDKKSDDNNLGGEEEVAATQRNKKIWWWWWWW